MTDTSGMQDRIGQLCGQFKLPTVGAQSVTRFTAAGHGDALATFLEVLEQEAEDRRHRRINRLRRESRLPSGKTWETPVFTGAGLRARSDAPGAAAATGSSGPGQLRRARRQRAGLRTAWHRQDPCPVRPGPPPGGSRPLRPLCSGLPSGAGTAGRQARPSVLYSKFAGKSGRRWPGFGRRSWSRQKVWGLRW